MVSTWNERCLQPNYVHFKDSLAYNGTFLSSELYLTRYIIHTFQKVAADFKIYNCCFSVQLQAASVQNQAKRRSELNAIWNTPHLSAGFCYWCISLAVVTRGMQLNAWPVIDLSRNYVQRISSCIHVKSTLQTIEVNALIDSTDLQQLWHIVLFNPCW